MPRRNSKTSTAATVQIPVLPGFKAKGKPRGKAFAKGEDPRRNTEQLFQVGNTANPGGQPVKSMRELRAEYMVKVPLVIQRLMLIAMGGPGRTVTVQAIKEFLDRIVGKVPLPIVGGGEGEPPLAIDAASAVAELRRIVGEPVKVVAPAAGGAVEPGTDPGTE
jgi:hypothetical protein